MKIAQKIKRKVKSKESCCESGVLNAPSSAHPDHSEFLPRLNRVQGQIQGIEKMIKEGRYCVDILVQFRAVMAALRSVEVSIFESHLSHCLNSAFLSKDEKQIQEKIKELSVLLTKRTSL